LLSCWILHFDFCIACCMLHFSHSESEVCSKPIWFTSNSPHSNFNFVHKFVSQLVAKMEWFN
jgi:hypothetical protein